MSESRSEGGWIQVGYARRVNAMDRAIWGNCPKDVMELILAKLPFKSLVKFRNVCKSWNRLFSSRVFQDMFHQNQQIHKIQQETWYLSGVVAMNKVAIYAPSTSMEKWRIGGTPRLLKVDLLGSDVVVPLASMGGLVCLTKLHSVRERRSERVCTWIPIYFIWNPLTNDCRQVPWLGTNDRTTTLTFSLVGMYVDSKTKEYKLIAMASDPELHPANTITKIYNSSTNIWKPCEWLFPFLPLFDESSSRYDESRWSRCWRCNSSIYIFTGESYILAFEMKTEVWREIQLPTEIDRLFPSFIEHSNKVYIVEGMITDQSLRIWQLLEQEHVDGGEHMIQGQCIEVDRLHNIPQDFYEYRRHPFRRCMGGGDFLFFKFWNKSKVLMYNIPRRSWSRLPVCELEKGIRNSNLHRTGYDGVVLSPGWISP